MNLVSSLLEDRHEVAAFSCGKEPLDDWLHTEALRSQHQDITRVHVWTEENALEVLAYFSVQPTRVTSSDLSRSLAGGNSTVPGYLIAKLALDQRLHGQGYGGELLMGALEACVAASSSGGGRVIVVDPLDDEARDFYLANDFKPTKASGRLVMKVATAKAALEHRPDEG